MPDYTQFVKLFNTALPPSTSNCVGVLLQGRGGADTAASIDSAVNTRLADTTWRSLTAPDTAAKEGSKAAASSGAGAAAGPAAVVVPAVTVGRMTVSTEDRWRIQAAMRREEAKSGQARKEYNKKVTRPIRVTKGPSGDGFPAGRGRPI